MLLLQASSLQSARRQLLQVASSWPWQQVADHLLEELESLIPDLLKNNKNIKFQIKIIKYNIHIK
jgi:hypothetical protein